MESITDEIAAVFRIGIHELLIETINPCQECFFCGRHRVQNAIFVSGHRRLASYAVRSRTEHIRHAEPGAGEWEPILANRACSATCLCAGKSVRATHTMLYNSAPLYESEKAF